MNYYKINKQKAISKWSPVLKSLGVNESRYDWMSEMAEYHSITESASLNEAYGAGNAYANAANVAGMGAVVNPVVGSLPGNTWGNDSISGSGDMGQNLLPVAMKIAAQTIGLDLVAVKPAASPRIDLIFIDYKYDDVNLALNERPQVLKIGYSEAQYSDEYSNLIKCINTKLTALGITKTNDNIKGGRIFMSIAATAANITAEATTVAETSNVFVANPEAQTTINVTGIVEFLGFSRIDGKPMFRVYRQPNTAGQYNYYTFKAALNTFDENGTMPSQINWFGTGVGASIELVSALEDHIPGFSANWTANLNSGDYPMNRQSDDTSYSGGIAPSVETKSVQVGTVKVKTSLKRTEIEDIKASTGIDITAKMESILVNELSQTISKQIVDKIFEMGTKNRTAAPHITHTGNTADTNWTVFDMDTNYITDVNGETTYAAQRRLMTKINKASNYIQSEGRLGSAQFVVCNGALASTLQDVAGYVINPVNAKLNPNNQLYPMGTINGMSIYVDPNMAYDDSRIVIGRKNDADKPGIVFVPYLMAQSISIISEATMAPTMELRSRYAITEVGYFPEKQYLTIRVVDDKHILN